MELNELKYINYLFAFYDICQIYFIFILNIFWKYNYVMQVALGAYSDKSHGLYGFLNEIAESIWHLVTLVQSVREICIIENK